MCRALTMQTLIVPSVVGQHDAAQRIASGKDVGIGFSSSPIVLSGDNIVAKSP